MSDRKSYEKPTMVKLSDRATIIYVNRDIQQVLSERKAELRGQNSLEYFNPIEEINTEHILFGENPKENIYIIMKGEPGYRPDLAKDPFDLVSWVLKDFFGDATQV